LECGSASEDKRRDSVLFVSDGGFDYWLETGEAIERSFARHFQVFRALVMQTLSDNRKIFVSGEMRDERFFELVQIIRSGAIAGLEFSGELLKLGKDALSFHDAYRSGRTDEKRRLKGRVL
jgi:hypothetical protein